MLNEYDKGTNDEVNPIILLKNINYYNNLCCLSIGFNCDCENFMAELCVQNTLTNIWLNRLANGSGLFYNFKVHN